MTHTPRILFIEDDEQYGSLITDYLRNVYRYDVYWAKSYSEVKDMLKTTSKFDIIVTDIQLPGTTGDSIATFFNIDGLLKETPLLISSGLYDEYYLENKKLLESLNNSLYVDFCEKGKTKWLCFKIKQMLKIKELIYKSKTPL